LHSFAPSLFLRLNLLLPYAVQIAAKNVYINKKRRTRRNWVQLKTPDIRTAVNS